MRFRLFAMIVIVLGLLLGPRDAASQEAFRWHPWRYLPVLDGGRPKPFDTLAWETARTIANQRGWADPQTGHWLEANTLYLALVFEWSGWDQGPSSPAAAGPHGRGDYFKWHRPDKWDQTPLLWVESLDLRTALGLEAATKYVSPQDLSRAKLKLPGLADERPFLRWTEELAGRQQAALTPFERKSLELADRYWTYVDHRMGNRLRVIPIQDSQEQQWLSVAELWWAEWDATSDPTGLVREIKQRLRETRAAYLAGSAEQFNTASAVFLDAVRRLGPQLGPYPSQARMSQEVFYNHWAPFRFAWILTALSFTSLLLALGSGWKFWSTASWWALTLALVAMLVGFALRVSISGRAPVTNMHESVLYFALGALLFGMVFEWKSGQRSILAAAAAIATVALILADHCPVALDPAIRPLTPVLRSNFWLVTHVLTITLSYAAFALALGIGNITLGYYLTGVENQTAIQRLSQFTSRAVQAGVWLLAAGTILGGIWADYSWGRFWGWDPKETWALIALLGYLAVLHARFAGWIGQFGLAALAVLCFLLVLMAWYGVNFLLGTGLHSYGFSDGGKIYVFSAMLLQSAYVAAAVLRHLISRELGPSP